MISEVGSEYQRWKLTYTQGCCYNWKDFSGTSDAGGRAHLVPARIPTKSDGRTSLSGSFWGIGTRQRQFTGSSRILMDVIRLFQLNWIEPDLGNCKQVDVNEDTHLRCVLRTGHPRYQDLLFTVYGTAHSFGCRPFRKRIY